MLTPCDLFSWVKTANGIRSMLVLSWNVPIGPRVTQRPPRRQTKNALGLDRREPEMAVGQVEGHRAMKKPPLIRTVKAKAPATLEIVWSTGETSTVERSLAW